MSIDQVPEKAGLSVDPPNGSHSTKFIVVYVVLAALAVGEIYTVSKMGTLRTTLEDQQTQTRKEVETNMQDQLSKSISDIQRSNTQQIEEMKTLVDAAAKRSGAASAQARNTKTLLSKLQQDQQQQADQLKQEISQKADAQQVGALTQDVSATKTDLEGTKKNVDTLRSDLGMARSELGTLIARNHDDIETLRKLGERDYFEFTLSRNKPAQIAGVNLVLKRTNVKRHRFNMALVVDDMTVEKKDRTANEPIFFYIHGAKKPFEVVVNSVQSNEVKGYLSTPKGATEVAARSGGSR